MTVSLVQIDDKMRRGLIILSKLLQNIANVHTFTEDYMKPFNSVVDEYSPILKKFFDDLASNYYSGVDRPSGFTLTNCVEPGIYQYNSSLDVNVHF